MFEKDKILFNIWKRKNLKDYGLVGVMVVSVHHF
jgi:hypothetical protein